MDFAGNAGEAATTVAVGNSPPAGPAALESRPVGAVAGGTVRFVNNTRISLNYDIKDVGPSKVSVVELWYTQDGRNWQKYNEDTTARSPYVGTVEREGQYGFTLLAKSGVGLGDPPPRAGDPPQIWVEVDLTKPLVQLRSVEVGRGSETGYLTINWQASDKNLGTAADHPVLRRAAGGTLDADSRQSPKQRSIRVADAAGSSLPLPGPGRSGGQGGQHRQRGERAGETGDRGPCRSPRSRVLGVEPAK